MSDYFGVNEWVSLLYLPAGTALFALLLGGQSAAIGVAAGGFGWNVLFGKADLDDAVFVALAAWAAGALTCLLFAKLRHAYGRTGPGESGWMDYSLAEVAVFAILLSIAKSALHQIAFFAGGEETGFILFLLMIVGELAGALLFFLGLNLTVSLVIQYRTLMARRSGAA